VANPVLVVHSPRLIRAVTLINCDTSKFLIVKAW
jgi:hypothetical protein